jgi:hypothetical protein
LDDLSIFGEFKTREGDEGERFVLSTLFDYFQEGQILKDLKQMPWELAGALKRLKLANLAYLKRGRK